MEHTDIADAIGEFKSAVGRRIDTLDKSIDRFDNDIANIKEELILQQQAGFQVVGRKSRAVETKAYIDFMRNGRETEEFKALQSGVDPDGGYLVPEQIEQTLTKYLRERSAVRQLATVVNVKSSQYEQIHSVGGTGYGWVGEVESRAETDAPTFKVLNIAIHEVYAMPAATQRLLDDQTFNLESWLVNELAETFGDAEANAFCVGDGVAKPRGLFTVDVATTADASRAHNVFKYTPTGGAGAFASSDPSDALIQIVASLKPAYRTNAVWLMHPEVEEAIRKFKSTNTNDYLWKPGLADGEPPTLLGYRVFVDENVPTIASNSLSACFGDISRAYTICDRSVSLLRDPYTAKPYVRYYSTKRVGAAPGRDSRAVRFLKFATT